MLLLFFVAKTTHTWYLSQISQIRYVEKNLSCGEISNLYASQMWRNMTFLHLLSNLKNFHMTDVEKSEVSPHLACIWCGECLYICTRYAVLSKKGVYCDLHRFVAKSVLSRFTHFCVEKNGTKYCVCGEKITNIRYVNNIFGHFFQNLRPKYTALKPTKSAMHFFGSKMTPSPLRTFFKKTSKSE